MHPWVASPLGSLLRAVAGTPRLKALVYHDVPTDRLAALRAQVALLARHYDLVAPDDFMAMLRAERSPERTSVLLTFDDGYASQATAAREVLEPLGIRALFFVTTGFVDAEGPTEQAAFLRDHLLRDVPSPEVLPGHLKPMSWGDVAALSAAGHAIGAHSAGHRRLSQVRSQEELSAETIGSGDALAERLGHPVDYFAYPFGTIGSIDLRAMDLIKQRYAACFSAVRGSNASGTSPYAILRDPVSLDDSIGSVRFVVEDGLGIFYRSKARRLAHLAGMSR